MSQTYENNSNENFLHDLKDDYSKRIEEVDAFSKRLSNACVEVNTECLYGCLDVVQHSLDLQKNYAKLYPWWFSPAFMTNLIKQNTDAWIQTVQNIDAICVDSMKNMKNNLRSFHKNAVLYIQNAEGVTQTFKNFEPNPAKKTEQRTSKDQIKPISTKKSTQV